MENVIKIKKINFVNKVVNVKGKGTCLRLLRHQDPKEGAVCQSLRSL